MPLSEAEQRALGIRLRQLAESLDPQVVTPSSPVTDVPPTTEPPVVTPTPTPATSGPLGIDDSSLKLVWQDDFNGIWPDKANWRQGEREKATGNHKPPGSTNGTPLAKDEKQFYQVDQVSVHDSLMDLKVSRRTVKVIKVNDGDPRKDKFIKNSGTDGDPDLYYWPWFEGVWKYQGAWASTGPDQYGNALNGWKPSGSLHEWLYGVFEFRVKLPKGPGHWPAIWMLRSDRKGKDEIDWFEAVSANNRKLAFHYHCDSIPDWTTVEGDGHDVGVDTSEGFNIITGDWTKDYIRWYFNGQLMQTTEGKIDSSKICKSPMYLIANTAIGGAWAGDPTATTQLPASLLIDSVKVWQR